MTNPNDAAFVVPAQERDTVNGEWTEPMYCGLTKREYFAVHYAQGPADDISPEHAAECLGWSVPPYAKGLKKEWLNWWLQVEAAWRLKEADSLIAELNKES